MSCASEDISLVAFWEIISEDHRSSRKNRYNSDAPIECHTDIDWLI
jgi:hypothetical protein